MYGPSVTPVARTVLALSGQSSWCPGSASLPDAACFSYQAPISAIQVSRSGAASCWPFSVIAPSSRYFISPPVFQFRRLAAPRHSCHEPHSSNFDSSARRIALAITHSEPPMLLAGLMSAGNRRRRTSDLLESLGLAGRAGHLPAMLSGGDQQRARLAVALARKRLACSPMSQQPRSTPRARTRWRMHCEQPALSRALPPTTARPPFPDDRGPQSTVLSRSQLTRIRASLPV